MASLFDWAGLALGAASAYSGYSAQQNASSSLNESISLSKERIAAFEATYGPIEDQLADYYSELTPEKYKATGLQAVQKEYQGASDAITESMATRGIDAGSGLSVAAEADTRRNLAESRANITANAESNTATQKMNFLSMGLGLESGIYNSGQQALAGATNYYSQQATSAGNAVGNTISSMMYKEGYSGNNIKFW